MADQGRTDAMRQAAAELRIPLPRHLSGSPFVVEGTGDLIDALAWCDRPHDTDHVACDHCHVIAIGHPDLAALIAELLQSREELAAVMDAASVRLRQGSQQPIDVRTFCVADMINHGGARA